MLHEFRGLVLFALKRYQEAAATDYAVLAVGPGWDWTTLSSFYPDVNVYSAQLRDLEQYAKTHPDAADARFLLAYQYLTCGHADAAAKELKQVVRLKPNDQVSAQLLASLSESGPAQALRLLSNPRRRPSRWMRRAWWAIGRRNGRTARVSRST